MKKLFTLIAGVLMAPSAFGQKTGTKIFNQDLENFSDPNMEYFECDEKHGLERGPVRIVEDPADPTNHCIKIVVRSDEEATADGNRETEGWGDNVHLISWDTQFFIYFKESIPAGKELRVSMKAKGEKEGSFQFQTHEYPQNYIYYQLFSDNTLSYTTAWPEKKYERQTIVSSNASPSDNFQCIALNMTCSPYDGNVVYLDDIEVSIRDQKDDTEASWINFMRKGIDSDDPVGQIDYANGVDTVKVDISNFMIQIRDNETNRNVLVKAPIVELEDGKRAVKVPTLDHYTAEVPVYEEDGVTPKLDEEGNPVTETHYYWSDGTDIGTSAPARYSSQFFVSTLHKMKAGERYKFAFWVKADKPAALGTQAHSLPTKYVGYDTFGGTSDFPITTDWTRFELGDAQGNKIPDGANGCQTITFDCYDLQEANNYYFIFEECSFTEANVTIADRTLGTPEDIGLAVNLDDDEKANTVDMAGMLNTFEVSDFSFLNNKTDGIKLLALTEPDDPEDEPEETFSGLLPWNDGGFINGQGYFMDDENGINIRLDEESIDGSKINVMVWNNPDSGISFDNGETLNTKLAISQSGWYYIYNITLSKDGVNGIKDIVAEKKNGVIYDLMGRKVSNPTKGIYIMDGKKYIMK